jgi:hypothetical protein
MKKAIITLIIGLVALGSVQATKTTATFCEYSINDPDFADVNYSESNRLGDTDFFGVVKEDGTIVILEEDMKWTVKHGDLDDITERLEGFEDRIIETRNQGLWRHSNIMWVEWATEAIEG